MTMNKPSLNWHPPEEFWVFLWDTLTTILFLSGAALVEVVLKPLFGESGPPSTVELILNLGDITLILFAVGNLTEQLTTVIKQIRELPEEIFRETEAELVVEQNSSNVPNQEQEDLKNKDKQETIKHNDVSHN